MRKIIHVDMDAFYASVEQRDFPELRGKALAVGGSPDGRGVVATASYEARAFGVHSALSSRIALQRCPELIFIRPRFEVYKEVSGAIREIFRRYTDLIEPLSLDEAYLDVSEDKLGIGSAIKIAREIKSAIRKELNLTASAGVSVNKFVAKIASDYQKPDGLTFIAPDQVIPFLEQLPIEKFHGVGKVTAKRMNELGVFKGGDLKRFSLSELSQYFGKSGRFFYQIVRGIDERPVRSHRPRKSVGVEDTFSTDLASLAELQAELDRLCDTLIERVKQSGKTPRSLTLKVKFADFTQITRSYTSGLINNRKDEILRLAFRLLEKAELKDRKVRLLGLSLSNFLEETSAAQNPGGQLRLF